MFFVLKSMYVFVFVQFHYKKLFITVTSYLRYFYQTLFFQGKRLKGKAQYS